MTLALPPLPCSHCGACEVPTLGPGAGQHTARANCSQCGRYIKWLPRALVHGKEHRSMGGVNRVVLVGVLGKYGVTVKFSNNGTPCASFTIVVSEPGQDGKDHATYVECEAWGKRAESCSELTPGQLVSFEGRLRKRPKGDAWEMVVSGFEVCPLQTEVVT
jgi:hypothetical protein